MIIKLIGCVMVLVSSIGIGMTAGNERKNYLARLIEIRNTAFLIHGDLRYSHTPMPEAIKNAAERHSGELKSFLQCVVLQMEEMSGSGFLDIWRDELDKYRESGRINKKQQVTLMELGKCLYAADLDTKLSAIEGFIHNEDENIGLLKKTENEKVRLYRSLGILAGIFVIVLLF